MSIFPARKLLLWLSILGLLTAGCATSQSTLRTQGNAVIGASGTYILIMYGASHFEDYAALALIVPENGKYKFEIFKPDYDIRKSKPMTAQQAMDRAAEFVKWNSYVQYAETRGILAPDGSVIAYEVRPLYNTLLFGRQDIMMLTYILKADNIVEVRVELDEAVTNYLRSGGDGRD